MISGKLCGYSVSHFPLPKSSMGPVFSGHSGYLDLCGYPVKVSLFSLDTWPGPVLGFAVAGQGPVGDSLTVASCFQGLSMVQI